jgi:hypothetical protein
MRKVRCKTVAICVVCRALFSYSHPALDSNQIFRVRHLLTWSAHPLNALAVLSDGTLLVPFADHRREGSTWV